LSQQLLQKAVYEVHDWSQKSEFDDEVSFGTDVDKTCTYSIIDNGSHSVV